MIYWVEKAFILAVIICKGYEMAIFARILEMWRLVDGAMIYIRILHKGTWHGKRAQLRLGRCSMAVLKG